MFGSDTLKRFVDAQASKFETALSEIKSGKKQSHWMWFIFPQIHGLGYTEISKFYAIKSIQEAQEYLQHTILGARLIEISTALVNLESNSAHAIFGTPDDLKLKSCMTLFSSLPNTNPVFLSVLDKFFNGARDEKTLKILADE